MTEQEIKLQEFKALDADKKREKLLAIFEFAKDKFDFSKTAINYLSGDASPNELVMDQFYEFVVSAIFMSNERINKQKLQNNEKMQSLRMVAESEEDEDAKDADILLDLFNLI